MSARNDIRDSAAAVALEIYKAFGVNLTYLQNFIAISGSSACSGFSATLAGGISADQGNHGEILGTEGLEHTITFYVPRQAATVTDPAFPPADEPVPGDVLIYNGLIYVARTITVDSLGAQYRIDAIRNDVDSIGAEG